MKTEPQQSESKQENSHPSIVAQRPLDSTTLLGRHDEVEITHRGEIYRLRRTRQGKLILTK